MALMIARCHRQHGAFNHRVSDGVVINALALQTAKGELMKQRERHQKAEAETIRAKAPAKKLANAIAGRRWQVGLPQFHVGKPVKTCMLASTRFTGDHTMSAASASGVWQLILRETIPIEVYWMPGARQVKPVVTGRFRCLCVLISFES